MKYHSDRLVTIQEARRIFGLSRSTIAKAKHEGRISPAEIPAEYPRGGRGYKHRYRYGDLLAAFGDRTPARCDRGHYRRKDAPQYCEHGTP